MDIPGLNIKSIDDIVNSDGELLDKAIKLKGEIEIQLLTLSRINSKGYINDLSL